jgi:hypothetical protein
MTRRKGRLALPQIKRKWQYHVALSVDKVRGVENSEIVWRFAKAMSAGPRSYFVRGDDLAVFCFGKLEDAQAFAERFGDERLSSAS